MDEELVAFKYCNKDLLALINHTNGEVHVCVSSIRILLTHSGINAEKEPWLANANHRTVLTRSVVYDALKRMDRVINFSHRSPRVRFHEIGHLMRNFNNPIIKEINACCKNKIRVKRVRIEALKTPVDVPLNIVISAPKL